MIPGQARLGVDVRGVTPTSLDRVDAAIRAAVAEIAARAGRRRRAAADPRRPSRWPLTRRWPRAALAAAGELGIAAAETWSGAGHDAQHLAALMPSLLLFVPLHGGESHTPHEGADMDEIVEPPVWRPWFSAGCRAPGPLERAGPGSIAPFARAAL